MPKSANSGFIGIGTETSMAAVAGHVEKDVQYGELKDKIQAMVSNKIAINMGPVPMDVGEVVEETGWKVDAVWPTSRCYKCGGYGHFARDCATKGDAAMAASETSRTRLVASLRRVSNMVMGLTPSPDFLERPQRFTGKHLEIMKHMEAIP